MMPELPQEPQTPVKRPLARRLAYSSSSGVKENYFNFRVSRGYPFQRAGQLVQAIPQFKALTLYSPVSTNSPTGKFQTTITGKSITYPVRTK